jgi:hypothetical protein
LRAQKRRGKVRTLAEKFEGLAVLRQAWLTNQGLIYVPAALPI